MDRANECKSREAKILARSRVGPLLRRKLAVYACERFFFEPWQRYSGWQLILSGEQAHTTAGMQDGSRGTIRRNPARRPTHFEAREKGMGAKKMLVKKGKSLQNRSAKSKRGRNVHERGSKQIRTKARAG